MEKKHEREKKSSSFLVLFLTFFKIGIMTFGGGYAMIPVMQKEFVSKKRWITDKEMMDMIAISESTPGSLSVNAATFIGSKLYGWIGASASTFGVILPSFLIILVISHFLGMFQDNIFVRFAFFGIRAGVLALVIKALVIMAKQALRNLFSYILIIGAFITEVVFEVNTILVIAGCGIIGLASVLLSRKKSGGR